MRYREYTDAMREQNRRASKRWRAAHPGYFMAWLAVHRDAFNARRRMRRSLEGIRRRVAAGFLNMPAPKPLLAAKLARQIIGNAMIDMGDRAFPDAAVNVSGFRYLAAMCLFSADSEMWPERGRETVREWVAEADRRGSRWFFARLRDASRLAASLGAPEWAVDAIGRPSATFIGAPEEDAK